MTSIEQAIQQADAEAMPFACKEPGCTRRFPTQNGLQGHMIAHMPPIDCPECGKTYKTPGALGNHRKSEHGIEGNSATQRSVRRRRANRIVTHDFQVDDIFQALVRSLWPDGRMPVSALFPLLEWREATREFLEKVQSGD